MSRLRILASLALILGLLVPLSAQSQGEDHEYTDEDAELLETCMTQARDGASEQNLADCIGVAANQCQEEPDHASTIGIVECLARETAWWDERLNASYTSLRATLDKDRSTALRDAQRAWIAFRDADCLFQYDLWREGTIRSIMGASCQLDHTARRAIALENFSAM